MLKIKLLDSKIVDDYYNSISKKVLATRDGIKLNKQAKKSIYDDYLGNIIKGNPAELIQNVNLLMNSLVPGFDINEYFTYNDIKNKKTKSQIEKGICKKYSVDNNIRKIFNYESFISQSKKTSYDLAKSLNRNTCSYCNRLYANVVESTDPKTRRINDLGRITRPQFDHWFSQKYYPLLALSIYNLIPSCSVCNSSIKGDTRFNLSEDIHPYILDKYKDSFTFSFSPKGIGTYQVETKTNGGDKINKFISDFKIKEIYNAHADYELKDLVDLRLKYPNNYIKTLLNDTFNGIKISEEEIYRLVFGVEMDSDNYHKRTFSKFKCDIINELKKIK